MARGASLTSWRLMWHYGGKAERSAILYVVIGCALMLLPFFFLGPLSRFVGFAGWPQLGAGVLIAGLAWVLFRRTVSEALRNARFYDAFLREGDTSQLTAIEREYLVEWVRFKDSVGVDGQLPQITRLARLSMVAYFGLWLAVVPYILFLDAFLGDWTVLSFAILSIPIYLFFWILVRVEAKRTLAEASLRGFRLAVLHKQAVDSHHRVKLAWF